MPLEELLGELAFGASQLLRTPTSGWSEAVGSGGTALGESESLISRGESKLVEGPSRAAIRRTNERPEPDNL